MASVALMIKNSPANTGNLGLVPWLGRSPEEGVAISQPSILPENSYRQRSLMDYSPQVTMSQTRPSD